MSDETDDLTIKGPTKIKIRENNGVIELAFSSPEQAQVQAFKVTLSPYAALRLAMHLIHACSPMVPMDGPL